MNMKKIIIICFLCLFCRELNSQWSRDGLEILNPISTTQAYEPSIAADGAGGAFICWSDFRNNINWNVFVQRVDENGFVKFTANGIQITDDSISARNVEIVSDGAGGAFMAWQDSRGGIFAQKINSLGQAMWAENGVRVSSNTANISRISGNAQHKLIVAWVENENHLVLSQCLDQNGIKLWNPNSVIITNSLNWDGWMSLILNISSSNDGSAYISYISDYKVFLQKVTSEGLLGWQANGIQLSDANKQSVAVQIVDDNSNGAIVSWGDFGMGGIYYFHNVQKIDAFGNIKWPVGGVALNGVDHASHKTMSSDNNGGAVIRSGEKVYHLNSNGDIAWSSFFSTSSLITESNLCSDGVTGTAHFNADNNLILAQWIDMNGNILFGNSGVNVVANSDGWNLSAPNSIINKPYSSIVCFTKSVPGMMGILAQKVDTGFLAATPVRTENNLLNNYELFQNYPNPFNPTTTISYNIKNAGFVKLHLFDVTGKLVKELVSEFQKQGEYRINFNAKEFSSGVYFYRLSVNGQQFNKKMQLIK